MNIVGARPNFVKMAPLIRAMKNIPDLEPVLVHTGQHYDYRMSQVIFDQLGIPSMFADTNAGSDFVPAYSGYGGDRNSLRGFRYWNDDMSISKIFKISEGKQVSFRVEAYNLTNRVSFANPTLSIYQASGTTSAGGPAAFGSSTFGETTKTLATASPRVLQMALRFTF